jgi:tRNA G18 (ribose-2'-O)-methylase SpoU
LIRIDNPDDPRIAAYRNVRERDLVGREHLFIAEGEVVLRHLIASERFTTVSALLAEKRAEKLAPLITAARPDAPVYLASEAVLDVVAGFPLHRGILAIGRKPEPQSADALLASLPAEARVLVLYGIGNHDNMGGLFRNAAAFGVAAVLLDPTCCDPLYRKAIRVSVGAALRVPFASFSAEEDPMAILARQGFEALALSPAGDERLADVTPGRRTAVILGAEGPGLPNTILGRCRTVRIPMAAGFDSLNVAVTGGIVLHHLVSAKDA